MEKSVIWIVVGVVVVAFFYFASQSELESAKDKRYSKCVEAMQEIIPDPNDDSRVSFLKDCFETYGK